MDGILSWRLWGLDACLVVGDSRRLGQAKIIADQVIDQVDRACNRFREDSELRQLQLSRARSAAISPVLARLLAGALQAAELTDGDVDPLLGRELALLGYDTDFSRLVQSQRAGAPPAEIQVRELRPALWREIRLQGLELSLPRGAWLDLGATAKALAADWAATGIAERLGVAALVCLGGDLATSGERAAGDWQVKVQDLPGDPQQQIGLRPGFALATSSTQKRRWIQNGALRHHILDPRSGLPAERTWRTVTVAAATCLEANACSTASVVRGAAAPRWLESLGVAARFVSLDGTVSATSRWPRDPSVHEAVGSRG